MLQQHTNTQRLKISNDYNPNNRSTTSTKRAARTATPNTNPTTIAATSTPKPTTSTTTRKRRELTWARPVAWAWVRREPQGLAGRDRPRAGCGSGQESDKRKKQTNSTASSSSSNKSKRRTRGWRMDDCCDCLSTSVDHERFPVWREGVADYGCRHNRSRCLRSGDGDYQKRTRTLGVLNVDERTDKCNMKSTDTCAPYMIASPTP